MHSGTLKYSFKKKKFMKIRINVLFKFYNKYQNNTNKTIAITIIDYSNAWNKIQINRGKKSFQEIDIKADMWQESIFILDTRQQENWTHRYSNNKNLGNVENDRNFCRSFVEFPLLRKNSKNSWYNIYIILI